MEESDKLIYFDLVRTQGLEGQVTVDVTTVPGTAEYVTDNTAVLLAPLQILPTTDIRGWHSFTRNGTQYLLMLKSSVVGELKTQLGTNGSVGEVDMTSLRFTTLFRWQGELTPVQVSIFYTSASVILVFIIKLYKLIPKAESKLLLVGIILMSCFNVRYILNLIAES